MAWQHNAERRSAASHGLILEHATMFFHNARGNRQAKAGARFLGGEERVKKTLLRFGRYALAGVTRRALEARRGQQKTCAVVFRAT